MRVVLFACVQNAGRSRIAAAWFGRLADPAKARALSAGTRPAAAIHPEVAAYLEARGFGPSREAPRLLTPWLASTASLLVTLGCGESCPSVPGLEHEDWPVPDPKGRTPDEVAAIGDELEGRVRRLVTERGWGRTTA